MTCPVCSKPAVAAYHPFCSRRCADVDLGRWLTESYRIPAESADEAEDQTGESPQEITPPKAH